MMKTTTLFIILDGFRHDYLDRAPYLKKVATWHGKVREPFGFISTRPAMFAGVSPEQTGLAFEYQFNPAGTTLRPCFFRFLKMLGHILPHRYLRILASAWLRLTSKNPIARQTVFLGNMPFDHFPFFELSESKRQTDKNYLSVPTIYDLLRQKGEEHLCYGFARPKKRFEFLKRIYSVIVKKDLHEVDRTMTIQFLEELKTHQPSFLHLHYASSDWVGHKFGPDSPEMHQTIEILDSLVKEVHEKVLEYYDHVRLVVTADHGMVDVTESYDLDQEILKDLSFSEPKDYLCFRDSTMARFWFFHPKAEEAIKRKLASVSWGKIIEGELKKEHRVRFSNNRNGDLIFLLNPGVVLVPNYYQASGAPPKGMHGYAPDALDNQGAIILCDDQHQVSLENGATIDLIDIFPTLCALGGFTCPANGEGKSILKS